MFPFIKVATLMIKTFTKPLLSSIMRRTKNSEIKNNYLKKFYIYIGQKEYNFEMYLNKKLKGVKSSIDLFNQKLPDEKLLERGIELFYELLIYLIIIIACLHEIHKSSISSKNEKEKTQKIIEGLQAKADNLNSLITEKTEYYNNLKSENSSLKAELELKNKIIEKEKLVYNDMDIKEILLHLEKIRTRIKELSN